MIRDRLAEFQLAVMLLTRLPAGRLDDAPRIGDGVWAFAPVGWLVGMVAALVGLGLTGFGLGGLLAGLGFVGIGMVITGALHEDGWADLADGLGGGRDRDAKLTIMRDSRIGSYGAAALILSVLIRAEAAGLILSGAGGTGFVVLIVISGLSRALMVPVLTLLPAARPGGLGRAAMGQGGWRFGLALILGVAPVLVIGWPGLWITLVAAFVAMVPAWAALRQLGGQTGDVLGAVQQAAEMAALMVAVALLLP